MNLNFENKNIFDSSILSYKKQEESDDEPRDEERDYLSDGINSEDDGSFKNNRNDHENDQVTPRRVLTESSNSESLTSASRRPQRPRTQFKRPQKTLKLAKKTMRLEAKVDSLNKKMN